MTVPDNGRLFLFSAVVERFLAEFATINSFTETIVETPAEGWWQDGRRGSDASTRSD
ncbi:MAG: type VI secretion system baseplate subunit TssF [Caenibius sp.]